MTTVRPRGLSGQHPPAPLLEGRRESSLAPSVLGARARPEPSPGGTTGSSPALSVLGNAVDRSPVPEGRLKSAHNLSETPLSEALESLPRLPAERVDGHGPVPEATA